jgi:MFS family permease
MNYLTFVRQNARWLAAAFLLTFTSSYGQTYFISIFAGQIREEFGLSHGAWGGIYTVGTTLSAIAMIWAGVLTDRFRVRTIGPIILVLLALACLSMAVVNSVWMLVVVIFALRFTGQGMIGHTAMVAMARWFVATRGRAMTVASMGFMIGQSALPVMFVALLPFFHWRALWVLAAILALSVLPAQLALLKNERTPQSVSKETQSVGMNGKQWRRPEVLRHWLFWLIVPSILGPSAWGTALFFQQVHMSDVKGWSHVEFVALFPLLTIASIATNLVTGWAIDRFGSNRLMPFYMIPYMLAFLVLASANSLQMAALGMVLIGVSVGAGSSLVGSFWAEHFGTLNLGAIKSMSTAVMVFGSAIGPGVTGWLIDQGIDFPDQMYGIVVYFVFAAVLAAVGVVRARSLLTPSPKVDIVSA